MFVGHEFLAFALVGWGAHRVGVDNRDALRLGGVAALAALLPDLDVAYAAATYAVAVAGGEPLGWETFWGVANGVHRVVTHPLPVGVVAALVFVAAATVARARSRVPSHDPGTSRVPSDIRRDALDTVFVTVFATIGVAILLAAFWRVAGRIPASVAAAFLLVVGVVGALVGRLSDASTVSLAVAASVGFLTHPLGDVFLAVPPPLLSPFGPPLLTERVGLATDPTVEILAVLFVELTAVWLGVGVASRLTMSGFAGVGDGSGELRSVVDTRSAAGVAYGAAVFVLPRPTIADAHLLGFTIVPLAIAVGVWTGRSNGRRMTPTAARSLGAKRRHGVGTAFVTGLTTLTLAAVAYFLVYLLVA